MYFILGFIFFYIVIKLIFELIFTIRHLRPLNNSEIKDLAKKRRKNKIDQYYKFRQTEIDVDKDFKSSMNPEGEFYSFQKDLYSFPSVIAGLLKYKKHQWIIFGFERDKHIEEIWLNKGEDNKTVKSGLSKSEILNRAYRKNYETVLSFHNHPNSNPNYFTLKYPSKKDKRKAEKLSDILIESNINYINFVCERGRHYKFFEEYHDNFYPLNDIINKIKIENNSSFLKNLKLHRERLNKNFLTRT